MGIENSRRAGIVTSLIGKSKQTSNASETCLNAFQPLPEKYEAVFKKELAILAMVDRQINLAKQSQQQILLRIQELSKKITAESHL